MKVKKRSVFRKKSIKAIAFTIVLLLLAGFCPGSDGSITQRVYAAEDINVTQGKPVSASSYMLPYSPERAIDGNSDDLRSRWVCADMNGVSGQYLYINLGAYYTCNRWVVDGIGYEWSEAVNYGDDYDLGSYKLQKSLYGGDFTEVANGSGNTEEYVGRFTARFVRLMIDTGNKTNNKFAAVQEFQVYGYPTALPTIINNVPTTFTNATEVSIQTNITDDGGDNVIDRGIVYSTEIDPITTDVSDIKVASGIGSGVYTTALTGLDPTTTYYARAYATNVMGTSYGRNISFNISRAVDTTVTADIINSTYGQTVRFTTTLSVPVPAANPNTPTGTVSFKDGETVLGTVQLSWNKAEYTTKALPVGVHNITAVYNGDIDCDSSTSAILAHTVNKSGTTATVTSSANPSVFGQPIIYTAAISATAPGSGTPTGTVTFKDGDVTIGTGALSGGVATYTVSAGLVGAYNITAVYNGDDNFNSRTSTTLTQTVNKSNTAAVLASSSNPSVFGQSVTYTATVNAAAPGSGTPTGTVTFMDGAVTLGTEALSGGAAAYAISTGAVGNHSIKAVYNGDTNFNSSTSEVLSQIVNKADAETVLTGSPNPSVFGQSVTYTATVNAIVPGSGTPTGSVTFMEGVTTLGTGTLSGGTATYAISSGVIGAHNITAVYSGDSSFNGSTSAVLEQTVNKSETTASVTSSPNPSVFGQSVTYTATVNAAAPGSGTPTGTVTFMDGSDTLGTGIINEGTATYAISSGSAGGHNITVVYNGDSNFNNSTSAVLIQTVNKSGTTALLTGSPNPSFFGQSVTYTAEVSATVPGSGTPTGTVNFMDGTVTIGSGTLSGGTASFVTSTGAVDVNSITAVYNGDTNFSSSTSAVLTQTVNKSGTTASVTSSSNPSAFGEPITYTATVSAAAPGSGTPTGTVTFKEGTVTLGTAAMSGGTAAFTVTPVGIGAYSVTVEYSGDASFNSSTSAVLTQTVNQSVTATTISVSSNPSAFGETVTYTATVSAAAPGSGTPTGTVTFMDGAVTLGTGTLSGGTAAYTGSGLSAGSHSITAIYNGDSGFNSSTSAVLTQTVNRSVTVTTIMGSPNPSVFGETVTYTATVSVAAPGSGTPTGTVTFMDGAVILGTGTLSGGTAAYTGSGLATGSHSITAVYSGDVSFNSSTSEVFTQTVNQAVTVMTITGSPNPSVFGETVTYTATVNATVPGNGTPTGIVTLKDGATVIATATLNGGEASFAIAALSTGSHTITAEYGGDSNFVSSISAELVLEVNKAGVEVSVTSSLNPSVLGQSVTFTAEARATEPGVGTPSGTVIFKDGVATLVTTTLNAGEASFTTAALLKGNHIITAEYSGDGNFNGCVSTNYTQTIDPTGSDKIAADKTALEIGFAVGDSEASVTRNLYLPELGSIYGSSIIWNSSNTAVISDAGIVTRPLFVSGDAAVTVTAAVYNDGASDTKDFQLTVLKLVQITHTVTFKDYDGSTIDTQDVAEGSSAVAPADPSRPGYEFIGWDKSFANVIADITVTAKYTMLPPALTDADKVEADKAVLQIGFAAGDSAVSVTQNLNLTVTGAVYGSTITWSSNNIEVINSSGLVFRPSFYSGNADVTVTAAVYSNGVRDTKGFDLTVLKLPRPDKDSDDSLKEKEDNRGENTPAGPTTTVKTTIDDTGSGTVVTTTTATTVSEAKTDAGGNASAVFTSAQVIDAVNKSLEEAAKQGTDGNAVVEIKVIAPADAKAVEATIPKAVLSTVADSNIAALTLSTPIGSITFDQGSLQTIAEESAGNVSINISKVETAALTDEVKQIVGDRPVFDFSITSGSKTISQFNGNVTVSVPYTPKANEDRNAIIIYYINAEGKAEIVSNCVYDPETGTITFTTNHFSRYAVGYNKVNFKDVAASAWYRDAVSFVSARGISTGTGEGNYSPGDKLTRGQFIVMTMRAYGIDPDENPKSNFADGGNTYYTGYLAAAKRLGISSGVGNNMYSPEKEITRQEMFTLIHNTLDSINGLPATNGAKKLTDFADAKNIAPWAKGAMSKLIGTGIISGSNGNLNPTAAADRAQMAQVLYKLLSE